MGVWDTITDLIEAAAPWSVAEAEAVAEEPQEDTAEDSKADDEEADEEEEEEDDLKNKYGCHVIDADKVSETNPDKMYL